MVGLPCAVSDALRGVGGVSPDLREVSMVLDVDEACAPVCSGGEGAPLTVWLETVVGLVRSLAPHERAQWDGVLGTLETLSPVGGAIEESSGAAAELVGLAELAGVGSICGSANRAAPHARDVVGRFFQKSIEQGCFFGDVRMSPAHFYALVSLTEPLLPRGRRGPAAIPAAWRIFAVLFWLAQGGSQRVVARAADVAQSTFSKFCDLVIQGMLAALPIPSWPTQSERLDINCEFSEMTGGNAVGWAGLYLSCFLFLCCCYTAGAGDLYMVAGREQLLSD